MYSTKGIILHREDFRERDERVVLYTKDFGKISVVVKGVKRIEAKLRGNVDIFNVVDITFVEGAYFLILTGIECGERFDALTHNESLYRTGLSCARMTLDIFEERDPDKDFFETLRLAFERLNTCGEAGEGKIELYSWLLFKKFQIETLKTHGYRVNAQDNALRLTDNSIRFMEVLEEATDRDVRISQADCICIEEMLAGKFEYFFRYKIFSWVPRAFSLQ